jgi:predicted ArsR family transcriptional regulator
VLKTEGILDGWESTEQGFLLRNHACPYLSAADASDCVCESDRLAIEDLVGASVERVGSVVQGDSACEYIVTMPESSGPEISGPDSAATKTDPNTRGNSRDEKG